mgnify:FL=1
MRFGAHFGTNSVTTLSSGLWRVIWRVCQTLPQPLAQSTTISEPIGDGVKSGFVLAFPNGLGIHLEPKTGFEFNAHANYSGEACYVLLGRKGDTFSSLGYNVADDTFWENLEQISQASMKDLYEATPALHNFRNVLNHSE